MGLQLRDPYVVRTGACRTVSDSQDRRPSTQRTSEAHDCSRCGEVHWGVWYRTSRSYRVTDIVGVKSMSNVWVHTGETHLFPKLCPSTTDVLVTLHRSCSKIFMWRVFIVACHPRGPPPRRYQLFDSSTFRLQD